MQTGHEHQIACDIDQAGHEHEQQRRTAGSQTAEHRREHVVCNDEQDAAAADAHIACRERERLLRCLHEHRDRPCEQHEQHEQTACENGEHDGRAAEHRADLLFAFFADIPRDQHGNAHRKLRHDECHEIEHLTAGRDRRQTRGRTEASDNEQVDRAVGRL